MLSYLSAQRQNDIITRVLGLGYKSKEHLEVFLTLECVPVSVIVTRHHGLEGRAWRIMAWR